GEGDMVVFDRTEGVVRVLAHEKKAQVLLLGGQPLGEPVSRYGPFVMNSRQEIVQAVDDYQSGRLVQ
ncbi:MAG: pirin-like C-terminal cupin domain-containing protein, partial [Actinomycetota bacterium]